MNRLLPLGALILALVACSSPLRSAVEDSVAQDQAAVATDNNANYLDKASVISVTFDHAIDPATLKVSGTLAASVATTTWASPTSLKLAPGAAGWPLGSGQTLAVDAADTTGWAAQTFERTYGVLDGVIYLSDAHGSDKNPGTADLPVTTVYRAFLIQYRLYHGRSCEVRVAAGSYSLDSFAWRYLYIGDAVSVTGGWDDAWSGRNPAVNLTELYQTDRGEADSSGIVLDGDHPVTLSGLTVSPGAGTAHTTGILASRCQLSLEDVAIKTSSQQGSVMGIYLSDGAGLDWAGGSATSYSKYLGSGLHAAATAGSIAVRQVSFDLQSTAQNCVGIASEVPLNLDNVTVNVTGASADSASVALEIFHDTVPTGSSTIRSSTFQIKTTPKSIAVILQNETNPVFSANTVLLLGSSSSAVGFSGQGLGNLEFTNNLVFGGQGSFNNAVYLQGCTAVLTGNTLHGGDSRFAGTSPSARALRLAAASRASLTGNLLVTSDPNAQNPLMAALYLDLDSVATFTGLNGVSEATYLGVWSDGTRLTPGQAAAGGEHDGLVSTVDPVFLSSAALTAVTTSTPLSPTSSSPAALVNSTLTTAPATDRYGAARTLPYSLGAVEF